MKNVSPAILLLVSVLASSVAAENWPSWRGPQNQGISSEKNLPVEWSADENIAWKLPLPGAAGSTPVVWDDHIFLTSVSEDDLLLLCIGTDGEEKWRRKLGSGNRDVRGDEGNSAAPSPSTDGKHVWAFFSNGSLGCFDFEGNEVWQIDVQKQYGKFDIQFGLTSTPVLHGDKIYLQLIHSGGAKVVALDKATGKEVWAVARKSDARQECEHSYASPIVYDGPEAAFLLTHGADYSIAYDLETGEELWRVGGLHPPGRYDVTLRFVSSPVAKDGMVIVPSAKRGITAAVKTTGKGNITDKKDSYYWTFEVTPDVPSPLIVGDLVYLCRENGNLIALEKETGKQLYEERTNRIRHRASPVYADGKIYLTGRDGMVTVVQAGPEFKILAQNEIGEAIAASPVLSNGKIYLRTFDSLWAIGDK
ncbi:outer membrane protein assembly factor BamB family protein [Bremerella sp. T1]|uniref:outer membrane protein assembly factor BamB family protein n=1 Tax=Bremerella sp. TYQ1 TaxID=3119568 RepID=UPI001CCCB261|nr:PQQ-binding-like beta-propeller repeat protein [Bremerella volcania]UBM37637.1 PQQ-binding-like beta-propeller repeat protein [Bremerella volcania]